MDMDKLILLDVDGTLADIHQPWLERVNRDYRQQLVESGNYPYTFEDISDWDFGPKAKALGLGIKDCLGLVFSAWEHNWSDVRPVDPDVAKTANLLVRKYGAVDIVTANEMEDEILQWLSLYNISCRHFLSGGSKVKLQYRILVEDDPTLPDKISPEQTLLLRDRPWNRDVKERDNVIRFHYFRELPDLVEKALRR